MHQLFLLPHLLQALCTTLKLVVLHLTREFILSTHLDLLEKQARHVTMQGRDGLMLWVLCCSMKTLMLCRSFTDFSLMVVIKLQNDDPETC